jgi:hypothetical protein
MEPQPNTPQGSEPGPLPGFVDRAEPDRFCDLVLTGGVTSSIAYPGAVHALGSVFRFNGIGGSSSGGGTAALAAAAEYRRRHGSAEGFRQMLAGSAEVADGFEGRTGLAWLFQPDAGLQRLFDAIVPGVVAPTGKFWALVRGLLLAYGPFALVPAAGLGSVACLALASHFPASWLGALAGFGLLALALAAGAVVAGLVLWRDLRRLAAADHGLRSGRARQADAPREPITPWLHGLIQQVAGRAPGEAPLSFADLHGAPGGPAQALNDGSSAGARSIDLRMFSADVTRGLPLQLPLPDATPGSDPSVPDDAALYFLPQELATLFPADVMAHLLAVSPPAPGQGLRVAGGPGAPALSGFRRLPGAQLPVIVAARMTVSFPLLFRAVPLWALSRPAARAGQPPPPPRTAPLPVLRRRADLGLPDAPVRQPAAGLADLRHRAAPAGRRRPAGAVRGRGRAGPRGCGRRRPRPRALGHALAAAARPGRPCRLRRRPAVHADGLERQRRAPHGRRARPRGARLAAA